MKLILFENWVRLGNILFRLCLAQHYKYFYASHPTCVFNLTVLLTLQNAEIMEPAAIQRKPNFMLATLFFINFMIPRFFGLIPLGHNTQSLRVEKSRLWHIFCILAACAFFFFYPSSLLQITANSANPTGVSHYVEKLHFLATYVLAAAIYARQVFYSDEMMHFINDGIRIYFCCEPIVSDSVGVGKPFQTIVRRTRIGIGPWIYFWLFFFVGTWVHVSVHIPRCLFILWLCVHELFFIFFYLWKCKEYSIFVQSTIFHTGFCDHIMLHTLSFNHTNVDHFVSSFKFGVS